MKKYVIELNDDLSTIYEDIAKMNKKSPEETLQIILKQVIDSILARNADKAGNDNIDKL